MGSSITVQPAYSVVSLPRSLDASGQVRTAETWSWVCSKKRKRTEVAVGVDGESVNIYNIQSSGLVTSYAFPPKTIFSCPPFSLRQKATKSSPTRRYTYTATAGDVARIVCHVETSTASTASLAPPVAQSTRDLGGTPAVIHLDSAPSSSVTRETGPSFDLLTVHENGSIRCLAGDLSRQLWEKDSSILFDPNSDADEKLPEIKVEFVTTTHGDLAKDGLLASRESYLSFLDEGRVTDNTSSTILVVVTRPKNDEELEQRGRFLHVLAVYPHTGDSQWTGSGAIQCIFSARLPRLENVSSLIHEAPRFSLDPASGTLYELASASLTIYNVSGAVPRISSQLPLAATTMASLVRISKSCVAVASSDRVTLYDVHWRSALASIPASKKTVLLYYFNNLDLIIGIAGKQLVAFQLGSAGVAAAPSRKRKRGLLLDSINKGIGAVQNKSAAVEKPPRPFGAYLSGSFLLPGLTDGINQKKRSKLDKYARHGNVEGFEKVLASILGVERDETELNAWKTRRDAWRAAAHPENHLTNGATADDDEEESVHNSDFPEEKPLAPWKIQGQSEEGIDMSRSSPVDPFVIQYVLKRIFSLSSTGNTRLSIDFFPPNFFWWSLQTGNFTVDTLESALCHDVATVEASKRTTVGYLMEAIAQFDPTLQLLLSVLASNTYLGVLEVVRAVKLIMQGFDNLSVEKQPLLTNGVSNGNGTPEQMDITLKEEEEAAAEDIDMALVVLEDGTSTKEASMTLALQRLHSFPPQDVVKTLKQEFLTPEIISLVHLFRMQLANGGWLARYIDIPFDESDDRPSASDYSVSLVSDLLNCAIDAIGMGGWLSGDQDRLETEELVTSLKTEVSAALEGVEEATYLDGLLHELLLYGKSADEASQGKSQATLASQGQGFLQRRPVTIPIHAADEKLLPLGLKAEKAVSRKRLGAGGEIKERSSRDVGRLLSMRVGKYSLEKIVI